MARRAWLTPETPTGQYACRRLLIPTVLLGEVTGALQELAKPYRWEEHGDLTVDQTLQLVESMLESYYEREAISLVGAIMAFVTADPPDGVLPCNGAEFNRVDYPDLYDAIDPSFHTGPDTFVTPNLSGQMLIGENPYPLYEYGGAAEVTLTVAQMPSHSHLYQPPTINPDVEGPGIPDIGATILGTPTQTGATGGGQPHENLPPVFVINWGIIAVKC